MKPWQMMRRFGQAASGGGGGDPYWSNVVSLLHFDGADGSTSFSDEKGKTWVPSGGAKITTASPKFGSGALQLNGSGDYITCASNPDFAFGTGDFTVEGWFKAATSSTEYLFSFGPGWIVYKSSTTDIIFNIAGSNKIYAATDLITSYKHIALSRQGGAVRLFSNGNLLGAYTDAGPTNISAAQFNIGRYASDAGFRFNGVIDDFRITKGVARYTSTFTPPMAPFPND